MSWTPEHVGNFHRDGFLLEPGVFSPEEVNAMLAAVEGGSRVVETTKASQDGGGRAAKLAIWHDLGDDIWSDVSTNPRVVNGVRMLMGEEIAFFHGKVMLKEAREGGAWEWHQDYGYWYSQGFVFPRMISAFVALDRASKENGCLQVLRGSHGLGRLDHQQVGKQTGADPERVRQVSGFFDRVYVEMSPGDVLFFHCNLFHASDPNVSDKHRRSFIICYNALNNPQLRDKKTFEQRPCPVGADDAILRRAPMGH
ncbi:MAG: phytanoyl-CoA dioxygenase family protein [bacterium]|jgi:ectoine hydroxylase|nr:phytanoyl-CoA dioxygenase family protein [bacterium]